MLVSVILPVYNASSMIRSTIASILAMRGPDIEVIAVNDGSTDDTGDVLDAIAMSEPRVRVFHQLNGGAASARNHALSKSRGDILLLHDADDLSAPERAERTVAYFDAHPTHDLVGTWAWLIDEKNRVTGALRPSPDADECHARIRQSFPYCNPTLAFRRRAIFPDVGTPRVYDTALLAAEDYDLVLRLDNAGHRGGNIAERLYYYRRHAGQLTLRDIEHNAYRSIIVRTRAVNHGTESEPLDASQLTRAVAIDVMGSAADVDRIVVSDFHHAFLASLDQSPTVARDIAAQAVQFLDEVDIAEESRQRLEFHIALSNLRNLRTLSSAETIAKKALSSPNQPLEIAQSLVKRKVHAMRERIRHRLSAANVSRD